MAVADDIPPELQALGVEPDTGVPPELAALGVEVEQPAPELTPDEIIAQKKAQQAELEAKKTTVERVAEAIPESVTAGLESFGRTIPVAYQMFERAVGVPREEQERREREYPIASALGTAGGVAASLAAGVGPAAFLRKIGVTYTEGIGRALAQTAPRLTQTALGKMAAKTVTGALAGVAEAVPLGALMELDESVLQDRPFSAETVLNTGVLGGGVGGLLSGVPAAVGAIGQTAPGKWLAKSAGKAQFSQIAKALGLSARDIEVARGQIGPDGLPALLNDAAKFRIAGPFMAAEKSLERAKAMMARAGDAIGQFTREADARMTQELAPKVDDIAEKISDRVVSKYASKNVTKDVAETISDYVSDLKKQFPSGMNLSDVHELRKDLTSKVYGPTGQRIPSESDLAQAYRSIRSILTEEINDGLRRVGIDDAAWRVPQRQYHVAAKVMDYAQDLVDKELTRKPVGALETAATAVAGLKGLGTAVALKNVPGVLGKTGGWIGGALKNALESGAPKPVIDNLNRFAQLREQDLLSKIPTGPLKPSMLAQAEHLRLIGDLDAARKVARSIPNVDRSYLNALDDAWTLLARSHSPNMTPSFAAQKVKEAEDLLTPFARFEPGRTAFQTQGVQAVRAARDSLRASLAQSDAWGQAYRDAAARRLTESAAAISDPRRVAALQGLQDMTNSLQSQIATKMDELMGIVGPTTKQLSLQKKERDQVKRGINQYVHLFEEEAAP